MGPVLLGPRGSEALLRLQRLQKLKLWVHGQEMLWQAWGMDPEERMLALGSEMPCSLWASDLPLGLQSLDLRMCSITQGEVQHAAAELLDMEHSSNHDGMKAAGGAATADAAAAAGSGAGADVAMADAAAPAASQGCGNGCRMVCTASNAAAALAELELAGCTCTPAGTAAAAGNGAAGPSAVAGAGGASYSVQAGAEAAQCGAGSASPVPLTDTAPAAAASSTTEVASGTQRQPKRPSSHDLEGQLMADADGSSTAKRSRSHGTIPPASAASKGATAGAAAAESAMEHAAPGGSSCVPGPQLPALQSLLLEACYVQGAAAAALVAAAGTQLTTLCLAGNVLLPNSYFEPREGSADAGLQSSAGTRTCPGTVAAAAAAAPPAAAASTMEGIPAESGCDKACQAQLSAAHGSNDGGHSWPPPQPWNAADVAALPVHWPAVEVLHLQQAGPFAMPLQALPFWPLLQSLRALRLVLADELLEAWEQPAAAGQAAQAAGAPEDALLVTGTGAVSAATGAHAQSAVQPGAAGAGAHAAPAAGAVSAAGSGGLVVTHGAPSAAAPGAADAAQDPAAEHPAAQNPAAQNPTTRSLAQQVPATPRILLASQLGPLVDMLRGLPRLRRLEVAGSDVLGPELQEAIVEALPRCRLHMYNSASDAGQ